MDAVPCRRCTFAGYDCTPDEVEPVIECPPGTCGLCESEREAGQ